MRKKLFPVLTGLLGVTVTVGGAGCKESGTTDWNGKEEWLAAGEVIPTAPYTLPAAPDFGNSASVHDPSVFRDPKDGKYYAFGSHFAVASSYDLINWTQEISDGQAYRLYGKSDWRSVLAQSSAHTGTAGGINSTWAPDVEYIGGTYYMYYSLTSAFGSGRSVIGRVQAQDVLGPYSNEQLIVASNQGSGEPNCIDPELFYDKEGRLWMVYGSHYAGIFIKELYADGPNAGLPKEEGFGKLLWKGGPEVVEGPFIFYNSELGYYYLMTSNGSLRDDNGGGNYNMRVARSQFPDGPYTDSSGKDVASAYGGGNKLAGNYQFADAQGYGAMGHNSVIKKDGAYFAVYHTRFREGEGVSLGHKLSVSGLYFNGEGWPVMAPDRYAGEGRGTVLPEQLVGEYELLLHTTGNSYDFAQSERYTLASDGSVVKNGALAGSWELKQNYYVELTLGEKVYKGVAVPVWNGSKGVLGITAVSSDGRSLWAHGI